jgi:hypothetical protein
MARPQCHTPLASFLFVVDHYPSYNTFLFCTSFLVFITCVAHEISHRRTSCMYFFFPHHVKIFVTSIQLVHTTSSFHLYTLLCNVIMIVDTNHGDWVVMIFFHYKIQQWSIGFKILVWVKDSVFCTEQLKNFSTKTR